MKLTKLSVRIIGGKMKGRRIKFYDHKELRPTLDRVRETLFNWIRFDIKQAVCLDACAGSGVLGFEAVSQGANLVYMLDINPQVVKMLKQAAHQLGVVEKVLIRNMNIKYFLSKVKKQSFDFIFLDPPYKTHLVSQGLHLIANNHILKPDGLIYFEMNQALSEKYISSWQLLKQSQAGQIYFYLAKFIENK